MPTYVYRFLDSHETIEVHQEFTDDPLTEARAADGEIRPVKKVFTPIGVTFKGSGFYKTDSRGKSSSASGSNGSHGNGSNGNGSSGSESHGSESHSSDSSTAASTTSTSSDSGSSSSTSTATAPATTSAGSAKSTDS